MFTLTAQGIGHAIATRLKADGAPTRRIVFSQTRSAFMLEDPTYEAITYFALSRAYDESKR